MTRVKQIKKAPCDLKYVVTKAVESLKKDGIVIDADIVSAKLYGDIEKLSQMFFNIIKNAKDALEQSGVVKIVKIVSSVEGENAVIMVSDKGKISTIGMAPPFHSVAFLLKLRSLTFVSY